jgi:hypothetical protein
MHEFLFVLGVFNDTFFVYLKKTDIILDSNILMKLYLEQIKKLFVVLLCFIVNVILLFCFIFTVMLL